MWEAHAVAEAALPELRGLCETIHENEEKWRSETPEEYLDTVPGNAVAKLLVLRCVRPDRFVAGCKLHAKRCLGDDGAPHVAVPTPASQWPPSPSEEADGEEDAAEDDEYEGEEDYEDGWDEGEEEFEEELAAPEDGEVVTGGRPGRLRGVIKVMRGSCTPYPGPHTD